ncbi:Eco57I restriction-modification methylase domain-containing protein [candidate division KSB1 bacterium]
MPRRQKRNRNLEGWLGLFRDCTSEIRAEVKSSDHDLDIAYNDCVNLILAKVFGNIAERRSLDPKRFEDFFLSGQFKIYREYMSAIELPENNPQVHLPGELYEEFLKYSPVLENDTVRLIKNDLNRQTGRYYTPPAVTDFIVDETLYYYFQSNNSDPEKVRICDPAMGTGNFLFNAAYKIAEIFNKRKKYDSTEDLYKYIFSNCIFGADKDNTAVKTARSICAVRSGLYPDEIHNFINTDTLLHEFPFKEGFDIVIGNPPWLSFGLKNVNKIPDDLNRLLRKKYPNTAEYKISAYALFIEKAISLTKSNGFQSFIIPDSWLTGRFYSKLRKFLLTKTQLYKLILIDKDFWRGLNIGKSVVYITRKVSKKTKNSKIEGAIISSPEQLKKFDEMKVILSTGKINKRERKRIFIYPDKMSQEIVEKMENANTVVGEYIRFYSGLIGNSGRNSIVFQNSDKTNNNYGNLIESGRYLGKNELIFRNKYIKHDRKLYKSGYDVEKYLNPKIFVNQTGYILKSCFDGMGFFCLNNIHVGYPVSKEAEMRFYSALFNSKVLDFYYKTVSMESGRALAQTDIDILQNIPNGEDIRIVADIIELILSNQELKTIKEKCGDEETIKYQYYMPEKVEEKIEYLLAEWYCLSDEQIRYVFNMD